MGNQPSLRRSIQKERWSDVRYVLNTEDGRARARTKTYTANEEQVSALHLACKYNAPPDIVHALITTGQPMFQTRPSGLSPLHCALMAKQQTASPEVVRLLLDAFPHSVSQPCSRAMGSKTPLHLACEQKASSSIIQMLHEADPTVSTVQDVRGETPWDVARHHMWILHPKWRKKVKNILQEEPASNEEQQQPGAPTSPQTSRRASSRPSSPQSPPPPPVATATLVEDNNTAASQFPVAAATLVEPSAPPDTMDDDLAALKNGKCVLCWERDAEMALVPCGHVCLCTHCCHEDEILNATLQHECPICRTTFSRTLRVYPAGVSSSGSS